MIKRPGTTISGITFSQAKRIAQSEFEDDMVKICHNPKERTYDVFINEKLIDEAKIGKIKKFKKLWNNVFSIIPIKIGEPIKDDK